MNKTTLSSLAALLMACAALGVLLWIRHINALQEQAALESGISGYIYGYPLVLMNETRKASTNVSTAGETRAPINQFAHAQTLSSPSDRLIVSPNVDVLYSSAWLDLTAGPLVLHVPDTNGRYYLMAMMDGWTNVFADPGARTTGTTAADFAIVGPGWKDPIPERFEKISAPTNMVWILGRIQCNGPFDYDAVHAIQEGFSLTPLSEVGQQSTPSPVSKQHVTEQPPSLRVNAMTAETFFSEFSELLTTNPPSSGDQPIVEKLAKIGLVPGRSFNPSPAVGAGLERAVPLAQAKIFRGIETIGTVLNGWRVSLHGVGSYGTAYLRRASVAAANLGANLPEDAIYPFTDVDSENRPLNGAYAYRIRFERGCLPPVKAFWSITLYDEHHFLVENPINRYSIQSHNELVCDEDGTIDIIIQHDPPPEGTGNWLPAPAGNFNLILRMFWPNPTALTGGWQPPSVERITILRSDGLKQ